ACCTLHLSRSSWIASMSLLFAHSIFGFQTAMAKRSFRTAFFPRCRPFLPGCLATVAGRRAVVLRNSISQAWRKAKPRAAVRWKTPAHLFPRVRQKAPRRMLLAVWGTIAITSMDEGMRAYVDWNGPFDRCGSPGVF